MRDGIVVGLDGNQALVRFIRHSACKKCGACKLGRSEQQEQVVRVQNRVNAKVDDLVRIDMPEGSIITASLLAYGVPLLGLVLGLLVGSIINLSELGVAVLALLSLGASYLITKSVLEPRLQEGSKYHLVAVAIVNDPIGRES